MLSRIAFFHGDPWLVLFLPILTLIVIVLAVVSLFVLWWRFTKLAPVYLFFAFLMCASAFFFLGRLAAPDSILTVGSIVSFLMALPWSGVLFAMSKDVNGSAVEFVVFFAGAAINGSILAMIGRFVRKRSDAPTADET